MFLKELLSGGGYPFVVNESMGLRNWPKMAVINEAITQEMPNKPLRRGAYIATDDGSIFQYVRAEATLAAGTVVVPAANVTGTTVTADAVGDNIHIVRTTITAATGVDSEMNNYLLIQDAATSKDRVYKILGNTSGANAYFTISKKDIRMGRGGYDGNANKVAGVDTVLANGIVAHLYRPYYVSPSSAVEQTVVGIATGVVTDEYGTLIQVHGLGLVLCAGDVGAIVENEYLTSGGVAGTAKGLTNAGTTGLDAQGKIGFAKLPYVSGTAALLPCQIDLFGKW